MKTVGLDIGFGWVKYVVDGKEEKFPTWIGIWTGSSITDIEPISYEGREYVVGELAKYCKRIEVLGFEDLLRWTGLIVEHIRRLEGEDIEVVGGLSPKHYVRYTQGGEAKRILDRHYREVFPQGLGVLVDVNDKLSLSEGEQVLVLDVGYNTVDYLIGLWTGRGYKKIALDTIEGMGLMQALEIFKKSLPEELVGRAKDWARSRLLSVFEKGRIGIEGEEVDLTSYRQRAVEVYTDQLLSRLGDEIGKGLFEANKVVFAGGGANLLDIKRIRSDVIIPENPEFANARGFAKAYRLKVQHQ